MQADPVSTQRERLIQTGARVFHERGYVATGVRQVAAAAGVPQGSFTNHFRSKERFALAVLDHYAARLDRIMDGTLRDGSLPAMARIEAYFDAVEAGLRTKRWSIGCLVPDLATEAPALGEPLRTAVTAVLERQTRAFAEALGDLTDPAGAVDLAAALLAAWQGTLLRMKVERSIVPVERFRRTLRRLLPPETQSTVPAEPPADAIPTP